MTADELVRTDLLLLVGGIASQLGNGWQAGERDGRLAINNEKIGSLTFAFTQQRSLRVTLTVDRLNRASHAEIPEVHLGPGICSRVIQEHLLRPAYSRIHALQRDSAAREWLVQWQQWFLEQANRAAVSVRFEPGYHREQIISLSVVITDNKNLARWARVTVYMDQQPARLEVSDHAHALQNLVTSWLSTEQPHSPGRHRAPRFRIFTR